MTSKAIVIGSGFGGLAAAIRLRARGYAVTILEANEQLGGRASTWQDGPYRFDAGPTVITAPYLIDELFEMHGRDPKDYYELLPVDPFYRVRFDDGSHFDYVGDDERLLENIRQMNPRDVDGYKKMLDMSRQIFEVGYEGLADQPFDTLGDMMRIAPQMMRLKSYKTVYGMVSSYLKDPKLRQVFTFQPLLIGGNPFKVPSIYLLIHWLERKWGVWYAKGGTFSLINAMAKLIDELGIEVKLNANVERIETAGGVATGVHTADGRFFGADVVVSNADPSTVYSRMIDPKVLKRNGPRRANRMKQSMSLYVSYFATQGSYEDVKHHTIIMGPRYRELIHDIFERKVLSDDFSLYLHRPGATDPSMAPGGNDSFYVLSPVPNDKSGLNWEDHAGAYQERIFDALEATEMPGLRDRLLTTRQVDPRYFSGRLQSHSGAAFGPEPRMTQSAWLRYHNRSPDVDGLFFVGAGVHPGAGVPGVLSSARVLDRVVPEPAQAIKKLGRTA